MVSDDDQPIAFDGERITTNDSATAERKLSQLKLLATEGFQSLEQSVGAQASSCKSLSEIIAKIGRRAALRSKSN